MAASQLPAALQQLLHFQLASQYVSYFGGLVTRNNLHLKRFACTSSCNADETGHELYYAAVTAR